MNLNKNFFVIKNISECKKIDKFWGNELVVENNSKYCCKLLNLKKGYKCSFHFHKIKDETFFVLKGDIILILDKVKLNLKNGQYIRVLPYTKHSFIGLRDSQILEISTHHLENDSYRTSKSKKMSKKDFDKIKIYARKK